MTLATRLSAFFLAALAVVLLGFSLGLYLLAERYLYRQLDGQLAAGLEILSAAIDAEADGLKWHPAEDRPVTLGSDAGPADVRWVVVDDRGRTVAHSVNYVAADFPSQWRPADLSTRPGDAVVYGQSGHWRMAARHSQAPKPEEHDDDDEEANTLDLIAGISSLPVEASRRELGATLLALSTIFWVACAVVGRWLCHRALSPLTRMAAAARQMTATDLNRQLPSPETGDELEELGAAFNDLLARMQEAVDRQQRFAGDASHQLRTPLAGVLSSIEVARRRERSAADYAQVLDEVHRQAIRMRQIVESLLFLARNDSDRMQLECESIELDGWLAGELTRWRDTPRGGDLRAELHLAPPASICVQPALLAQLLDNLLDNAAKYSPLGTPIMVGTWRRGGTAGFTVEDQGSGIAPADLPHIFEPFYRSAAARREGRVGVGLGLAVAQRIVTSLAGTIAVESPAGRGARFVVGFPESASRPAQPSAPPASSSSESARTR
ncbi:MAG TPA: ATP-binding protein [Pirellulales bacterium]|jgi:heavy metal sensor kinase|nr:ATP-binding protein [Pirellulales bacterium]